VGDTRCGQPCHQPLAALDAMYRRLSDTRILDSTQVLFVSMAPRQDTPERLRRYLAPFDARFIGATGSPPSLGRLAEDLTGGAVAAAPAQYGGSLILIDPHGAWRAEFLPPFDAMQLTAEYLKTRVRR
jgi:protein SCO1/2